MRWIASLTMGNWLGLQGLPRVGAWHVLQARIGCRPGELLNLRQDDLRPHWMATTGPGERVVATVGLGVRIGTDLRRQQYVLVGPREAPIAAFLIGVFWLSTLPRARLSAISSVSQYNKILAWASRA